jgi:hypothetical protein
MLININRKRVTCIVHGANYTYSITDLILKNKNRMSAFDMNGVLNSANI